MASMGCRTVVSGGSVQFMNAESSYPTTDTSPGTDKPARRIARMAPSASTSLPQMMAVMPCRSSRVVATCPPSSENSACSTGVGDMPEVAHSAWNEAALEPWKHVMRTLLAHHARTPSSRLGHISTEILPFHDYGAGSRYSLFDDSVACARWLRETWTACSNNEARGVKPDTRHNLPNGPGLAGQPATTGAQQ